MSQNVATVAVDVSALEVQLEKIAKVLSAHKVFGKNTNEQDNGFEERGFKRMVMAHALEGKQSYLELTYSQSCVRFIVKTRIVDNVATLQAIDGYDHPWASSMDYDALNMAIKAV